MAGRDLVDAGGVHACVDRARHQCETARLARVVRRGHHRSRRERLDDGLAHRDEMPSGADRAEKVDHVLYVLVEAERAFGERDVATVVPVRDEHIVVGQHCANGVAQERREVTGHRGEQHHPRLVDVRRLGEMEQRAEGRTGDRFLVDRDPAAGHLYGLDRERPARVAQRRERRDLGGRQRRPYDRPLEQ